MQGHGGFVRSSAILRNRRYVSCSEPALSEVEEPVLSIVEGVIAACLRVTRKQVAHPACLCVVRTQTGRREGC